MDGPKSVPSPSQVDATDDPAVATAESPRIVRPGEIPALDALLEAVAGIKPPWRP